MMEMEMENDEESQSFCNANLFKQTPDSDFHKIQTQESINHNQGNHQLMSQPESQLDDANKNIGFGSFFNTSPIKRAQTFTDLG